MSHTELPWVYEGGEIHGNILNFNGAFVAGNTVNIEDAALIVKCVNGHDVLIEIIEATISFLEDDSRSPRRKNEILRQSRAALEAIK